MRVKAHVYPTWAHVRLDVLAKPANTEAQRCFMAFNVFNDLIGCITRLVLWLFTDVGEAFSKLSELCCSVGVLSSFWGVAMIA